MKPSDFTTVDYLEELERVRHARWRNVIIATVGIVVLLAIMLFFLLPKIFA